MKHYRHFKLTPLLALLLAASAQAQMPTGMSVVAGQAAAQLSGKQLTVTNTNNTILNWQSFSIGAGNTVNFAQPNSASQVLNRVTGNDPSAIFGSLTSNGKVWLLNPNGVLFGQGARVDVASLVTSTLNIGNGDWLAGRALFSGGAAGSVVNQGEIRTANGGRVALIGASTVSNEGLISAPDGQIILAAGRSVELVDTGAPNFAVKLTAPSGAAVNLGTLNGARVDLLAAAVNQQGVIEAQNIVLQADGRLTLAGGSTTRADGDGTDNSQGGSIKLLGQTIELQDGSIVSANGLRGGGTVLVGGGAEGKDASVPNAQGVYFAPGASISADALQGGDGGHIVLWADQATRAYGSLSAHGGAGGGNGGLVETSGHWLDANPAHLDVSAAAGKGGKAGTWLLDPYDITISSATSDSGFDPVSFTPNANNATISASTLQTALSGGNNVTISTSGGGAQNGDINVTVASINVQTPNNVTLTLDADRNITMSDANFTSSYGSLGLVFKSGKSGAGSIWIDDSYFATVGGAISVGGYGPNNSAVGLPGQPDGIKVTRSTIATNGGALTLNGYTDQTGGRGVGFDQSVVPNSIDAGNITINGTSVNGTGVQVWSGNLTTSGALTIDGTGGTVGVNIAYNGANSPVHLTGALLHITGASTGDWNGVSIDESAGPSSGSMLTASSSFLQIEASNPAGSSSAALNINAAANSNILSSGGSVMLDATGGGMTLTNVSTNGSATSFSASSDSYLQIDSGLISAGTIVLNGQYITLQGGLSLFATSATGTGITVSGYGGGAANSFYNGAGPQALLTEGSRYLIYVADAADVEAVDLGGLAYDFQQYGAPDLGTPYAGNGLLTAATKIARVGGQAQTKVYDGTTTANATGVTVTPEVSGDQAPANLSYTSAAFDTKDVGTDKVVTLTGLIAPTFTDSQGKPVYGYTIQSDITADITPAPLSAASIAAANKVYDGSTAAQITVGALSGLVGNETVNIVGSGNFSDKNVGNGKTVKPSDFSVTDGTNGGLASNYQFQSGTSASGGLTADITPAPLSAVVSAANKVYDSTTAAQLTVTQLQGLVPGETLNLSASGSFADKNVGTAKPVSVTYQLSDGTGLASNYQFSGSAQAPRADITPAALVFSVTAQNKVYDASTQATVSLSAVSPLGSDQVSVAALAAAFSDANAGTGKTVAVSGFTLSGADAGNYTAAPRSTRADITPATLSYVANTMFVVQGAPLQPFSGSVVGLVGGDTLQGATTGTASFASPITSTQVEGSYAINGQGLVSNGNYQFAQAPGNATALTIARLTAADSTAQSGNAPIQPPTQTAPTVIPQPPDTPSTGLVDLSTAPSPNGGFAGASSGSSSGSAAGNPVPSSLHTASFASAAAAFGSQPLETLSAPALSELIEARAEFKSQVFGGALAQLKDNPGLADVPLCKSLNQAALGTCLITEDLKRKARAARTAQATPAPLPAAPAATPVPGLPPVAQAVPAPAPVVPEPMLAPLFAAKAVKQAALPTIRRKMAVLIGNGEYQDKSIPALPNAQGDAHAVADLLAAKLGYETLVLDNPSKETLIATLNRLALESLPQDSVVVYYAGHGAQADADSAGYWVMSNSAADKPKSWLSNADISRLVGQVDARQTALISDSCYSGTLLGKEQRIRGTPQALDPNSVLAKRATVVMSSGANEPVFDSGRDGHSLFAWALMSNLDQVSGWQSGGNLFERVRFAVARVLPQRPQYGAAPGYQEGSDYLFEARQLGATVVAVAPVQTRPAALAMLDR